MFFDWSHILRIGVTVSLHMEILVGLQFVGYCFWIIGVVESRMLPHWFDFGFIRNGKTTDLTLFYSNWFFPSYWLFLNSAENRVYLFYFIQSVFIDLFCKICFFFDCAPGLPPRKVVVLYLERSFSLLSCR